MSFRNNQASQKYLLGDSSFESSEEGHAAAYTQAPLKKKSLNKALLKSKKVLFEDSETSKRRERHFAPTSSKRAREDPEEDVSEIEDTIDLSQLDLSPTPDKPVKETKRRRLYLDDDLGVQPLPSGLQAQSTPKGKGKNRGRKSSVVPTFPADRENPTISPASKVVDIATTGKMYPKTTYHIGHEWHVRIGNSKYSKSINKAYDSLIIFRDATPGAEGKAKKGFEIALPKDLLPTLMKALHLLETGKRAI